jgi:aspartyl-tRNA(Asn)/glutamyl-tRNA(Gln) amidotransferase subunit A
MEIMSGVDQKDMTTLPVSWQDTQPFEKKKVGLIKQFMSDGVDEDVRDRTRDYADRFIKLGYEVEEVDLTMAEYSLAIYYIVTPAEVASNLARYDGIRYGLRSQSAKTLEQVYNYSRSEGFELENMRRIMIGNFVLSAGYFDAYYLKAQKARTLLINEFKGLFEKYDFLFGPVAPTPAFKLGENTQDPIKMYLADVMTVPASLAGLPSISVPAGISQDGLPIGVQLIGNYQSDKALLSVISQAEEVE